MGLIGIGKRIKRMDLSNDVLVTGWKNNIGDYLRAADIYVASSIREGFGINLIEALYFSLPVVAVRNRGHISAIGDQPNCYLVSINNPIDMSNQIQLLLSNSDNSYNDNPFDMEKFESKKVAVDIVNTLEDVLNE